MILIDILLAFSLSAIFIVIIGQSSISSRQIFERAKDRSVLLGLYDSGLGTIKTGLHGNDLIEKNIEMASSSGKLSFIEIIKNSDANLTEFVGTPLCSVDYSNENVAGSYEYFSNQIAVNTPIVSITPITLPINPTMPLTDLEVRNGTAYISADSSIASDPDLFIVNIGNISNPAIISSINTGPGLVSISLAGDRIFGAAPSTASELHIIRLNGLANPVLEKKFKLPLPFATATPALASSIFYKNNKVYLGTEKWSGEEFNIIDVSDVINPVKIGGLEIGSKVNDIYVDGNIAYVASSDQFQLRVVDIKNPNNPTVLNTFSPSGWQRQEGKTISLFEQSLNFGRTSGGFNFISDHEAFSWLANSSTTLDNPFSIDVPSGVYGIVRDRDRIYLATRQVDRELQIFDTQLSASTSSAYSLPIQPQAMTCDGDHLYILAHTAPVIYKISLNKL
ncbi:MAG: hypothetical protein WCS89_00195 [Candidatus Paceibacterota bacterium]